MNNIKMNAAGTGVQMKCTACGGALFFDPLSGQMKCTYCGRDYSTSEVNAENEFDTDDTIECNVYICRSCGAELNVNDNECSTFCAYCGQPTVVFDRVARMKKPQFIIPFSVTKEQAVMSLRQKVSASMYLPDNVKRFTIDKVVGIYIPYWLYDIEYSDSQYIEGTIDRSDNKTVYYYFRAADTFFKNITLDASLQLDDRSSRLLEPYQTEQLIPFETSYLSGFYSDRYDISKEDLTGRAVERAGERFDAALIKDMHAADDFTGLYVFHKNPKYNVTDVKYAFLPAWFLSFRHENKTYTMMVNGQTGKIVGGLPMDMKKLWTNIAIHTAFLAIPASFLFYLLFYSIRDTNNGYFAFLSFPLFGIITLLAKAKRNLKDLKKSQSLTSACGLNNYSNQR